MFQIERAGSQTTRPLPGSAVSNPVSELTLKAALPLCRLCPIGCLLIGLLVLLCRYLGHGMTHDDIG